MINKEAASAYLATLTNKTIRHLSRNMYYLVEGRRTLNVRTASDKGHARGWYFFGVGGHHT
jgi:hypothetical protein